MQECAKDTHVITQVQLVCQPSMVHDLRDLKPHRLRPQRCQKTPQSSFKNFSIYSLPSPSPSLAVLVNRSLSDMQEGSQRCQHLQCLDRPLKPDPRTHTHTTHSACPLRQHTWWDGMPTAIRLGKYPSENQTIAIILLITSQLHTHICRERRSLQFMIFGRRIQKWDRQKNAMDYFDRTEYSLIRRLNH